MSFKIKKPHPHQSKGRNRWVEVPKDMTLREAARIWGGRAAVLVAPGYLAMRLHEAIEKVLSDRNKRPA